MRDGRLPAEALPEELQRRFRLVVLDWDGTAVRDRKEDATPFRQIVERLLPHVRLAIITGTSFDKLSRQFAAAVQSPFKPNLYLLTNRGSEVFGFDLDLQPVTLLRRVATPDEEHLLNQVAERTRDRLVARTKLDIRIVYDRLNRRKIDLIPLPEWADPPKSQIGELQRAVESRLVQAGLAGGIQEAFRIAEQSAQELGLGAARITSDVKHLEIGLTDKADSANWVFENLAGQAGLPLSDVLVAGDEFGPIAGFPGSDFRMVTPLGRGAVYISVGPEPNGTPPDVTTIGGGPPRLREILAALAARYEGRPTAAVDVSRLTINLPDFRLSPSADPAWLLVEDGFVLAREHEIESIFSLANGYLGSRGSLAEGSPLSKGATFFAGVFDHEPGTDRAGGLMQGPDWMRLHSLPGGITPERHLAGTLEHERLLDLQQGILWRFWRVRDGGGRISRIQGARLASLADRHLLYQVVTLTPENFTSEQHLECRFELPARLRPQFHAEVLDGIGVATTTSSSGITLAFATTSVLTDDEGRVHEKALNLVDGLVAERWSFEVQLGRTYRLIRQVVVYTSRDGPDPRGRAIEHLRRLTFREQPSLPAHVEAWRERWQTMDVETEEDPESTRHLRFAAYHLTSAANPEDEHVSIGARALSGDAYLGHVFWDTEIYMLPFLTFTQPAAARALLMYRFHRLPEARRKAAAMGLRGALFPWESADTGAESTPPVMLMPDGELLPVYGGRQEQHINADIAYAVWQYWEATRDESFLLGAGAELLIETARFWASRATLGPDGRHHLLGVMGPDEYHDGIDDNAFTNGMARWNLERAAEVARRLIQRRPADWSRLASRLGLASEEISEWLHLSRNLETGFDATTKLYEQFRGYFQLAPFEVAPEKRTTPLELLVGRDRLRRSQAVKQADVVMLLFLLRDTLPPDVVSANFRHYEPRTVHGSSLSPPVHALMAARLGEVDLARRYFRETAEIDLGNSMGNAAGGIHAAALGGLWQAAVFGFGGLRLHPDGLSLDPHLPPQWTGLRFAIQWRGRTLHLNALHDGVEAEVVGSEPTPLALNGGPSEPVPGGRRVRARRGDAHWRLA